MNNELNNNANNEINTNSFLPQNNNQNVTNNNMINEIPGANVAPIGAVPIIEPTNVSTATTPEIIQPATNINSTPVMPKISNQPTNPNPELKIESSSPFDIGLNNSNLTIPPVNSPTNQTPPVGSSAPNFELPPTGSSNPTPIPNNNTTTSVPLTNPSPNNQTINDNNSEDTVSVGQYLGNMILFSIPLIGIILLISKAISKNNNQNIRNYARAQLLFTAIMIIGSIILSVVFGEALTKIITAMFQ